MHILVTGACGTGTTTLGRALAADLGASFVDGDDLFWLPTDPPYTAKREPVEREALLREKVSGPYQTVVAGSIMGWGREVEDAFGLIVFLRVPTEVRVRRIRERELARFGRVDEAFVAWAAQYDTGTVEGRNLVLHQAWLALRSCPILRLSGTASVSEWLSVIRLQMPNTSSKETT